MARPTTVKLIIQDIDCPCCYTVSFSEDWKETEEYCKKLGYRKRVNSCTGRPVWYRYITADTCPLPANHRLIYAEQYPMHNPLPAKDPAPVKDVMTDLL